MVYPNAKGIPSPKLDAVTHALASVLFSGAQRCLD